MPYVDEHATTVSAGIDDVWAALLDTLDAALSGTGPVVFARAAGCDPSGPSGPRPLAAGSTLPGFQVVTAEPGRELLLEGCHRFSSYALVFRLEERTPERSRLRAESWAAFPGALGRLYRLVVIGTGAHVVSVRHLLRAIRSRGDARSSR